MLRKYKYRAWTMDADNEPVEGIEEEFTVSGFNDKPYRTAIIRAAMILDISPGESLWLESVTRVTKAADNGMGAKDRQRLSYGRALSRG